MTCNEFGGRPFQSASVPPRTPWRGCRRREVLGDRNLDHARTVRRQGFLQGVGDLLGALHVHAARAVHLGQLVEARVDEVDADVARSEMALLLRFLGAMAAV